MDLALQIRGLHQSFPSAFGLRRKEVLHGVDLELERGRFLGLVGPNGSGKSTLLRVIAGIDAPREGSVRVLGGDPDSMAIRARVGFCPEDSPFPPELKPAVALDLLGSLHGLARRERRARAERLLERVGLAHAARTPLGRFSRGMLRRFGIAQALLHEPDLILLDEPTAGLDAPGFAVVDELLDEARARGASVVVSSHLFSDLHRHCEESAALIDGRIVARGSALELARSLGARAAIDVSIEGLDQQALEALVREIERAGGRVTGTQPSQSNLLELYKRFRSAPTP